jgi:tocopherol cyclase
MAHRVKNGLAVCTEVDGIGVGDGHGIGQWGSGGVGRDEKLQTPHSGYHWHGSERRFFEGWYFRVTLPEINQSFAFMYSIDDPLGGKPHSGGCAQVLGPDEGYFCRTFPDVKQFWARCDRIALGHWRATQLKGPAPLPLPQPTLSSPFKKAIRSLPPSIRENYGIRPLAKPFAGTMKPNRSTAGEIPISLSRPPLAGFLTFPSLNRGWQVLMAHGQATGWIEWQGQRHAFEKSPTYAGKKLGWGLPHQMVLDTVQCL